MNRLFFFIITMGLLPVSIMSQVSQHSIQIRNPDPELGFGFYVDERMTSMGSFVDQGCIQFTKGQFPGSPRDESLAQNEYHVSFCGGVFFDVFLAEKEGYFSANNIDAGYFEHIGERQVLPERFILALTGIVYPIPEDTREHFGWVEVVLYDGQPSIIDQAMAYHSPGIVIGSTATEPEPKTPKLSIHRVPSVGVNRVMVTQNVEVGRNYVLESSFDMVTWTEAAPQFTANSERIDTEFEVDVAGRYFRLRDLGEGNINNPPDGPLILSDLGMKLMPIPAGTFVMGSPEMEEGRRVDEGPLTTVTISKPFWLGETEVTQSQWQAVTGNNLSFFKGDSLPVEWVSWHHAMAFCEKLNELKRDSLPAGYHYTLPTEAQWEYACRAGAQTRFYYGDDSGYNQLGQYAWYSSNSGSKTHVVGEKLPNAWGLYDMHGNVWEWCSDWWRGSYKGGSVSDPQGPESGEYRVLRGGAWGNPARVCRSANRIGSGADTASSYLGFRVALSSVPSE